VIKRILVATDDSPRASLALDAVADIAKSCSAEVTVAHIMCRAGSNRVPEALRSFAKLEHVEIIEQTMLHSVGERIVRDAEQRLCAAGVTRASSWIEVGNPSDEITAIARDINADLIAIGRRGLGSVGSTLLGGVSLKMMQTTDIPCLTVT
jgi:nucleotide-binding universal stress UspA family protein